MISLIFSNLSVRTDIVKVLVSMRIPKQMAEVVGKTFLCSLIVNPNSCNRAVSLSKALTFFFVGSEHHVVINIGQYIIAFLGHNVSDSVRKSLKKFRTLFKSKAEGWLMVIGLFTMETKQICVPRIIGDMFKCTGDVNFCHKTSFSKLSDGYNNMFNVRKC